MRVATRWQIDDPLLEGARQLRLVLVRHGESDWNAERRVQGHLGGGLTSRGRADAERTAEYLRVTFPRPARLLSSDLDRVVQTAEPYARAVGMEVTPEPRLREIDNGSWSGLTIDEVVGRYRADIDRIRGGADLPRGGGERVADLAARTRALVEDLAAAVPDDTPEGGRSDVVAFAHGGSIRLLAAYCLGLGDGGHRALRGASNCSVTELVFWVGADGSVHSGVVAAYNSSGHLEGPASGQGTD